MSIFRFEMEMHQANGVSQCTYSFVGIGEVVADMLTFDRVVLIIFEQVRYGVLVLTFDGLIC